MLSLSHSPFFSKEYYEWRSFSLPNGTPSPLGAIAKS